MEREEPGESVYRSRTLFRLLACMSVVLAFLVYVNPGDAHENDDDAVIIHVTEKGFEPESVEIEAGETVVFENLDRKPHWPASETTPRTRSTAISTP